MVHTCSQSLKSSRPQRAIYPDLPVREKSPQCDLFQNPVKAGLCTGAGSQPIDIDASVEEYMQMAARLLYDIIREWLERHDHDNEKEVDHHVNSVSDRRRES